jgi:hypothetical protein
MTKPAPKSPATMRPSLAITMIDEGVHGIYKPYLAIMPLSAAQMQVKLRAFTLPAGAKREMVALARAQEKRQTTPTPLLNDFAALAHAIARTPMTKRDLGSTHPTSTANFAGQRYVSTRRSNGIRSQ